MNRTIFALATTLSLTLAGPGLAADSPESLVKYRQSVMKSLGGHAGAIAAVVKGQVTYAPQVVYHPRSIKEMSIIIPDIFPPNSTSKDYKKTDALPEIWEQPEKFNKAVQKFQAAAVQFAEVAEGGDQQAIAEEFQALGKTCGGCHKPFRHEE